MVYLFCVEQWKNIEMIYFYFYVIVQCYKFLYGECMLIVVEEMILMVFVVKYVSEYFEFNIGVIVNGLVVYEYGLYIVCLNIYDYDYNIIRFVILYKDGV